MLIELSSLGYTVSHDLTKIDADKQRDILEIKHILQFIQYSLKTYLWSEMNSGAFFNRDNPNLHRINAPSSNLDFYFNTTFIL